MMGKLEFLCKHHRTLELAFRGPRSGIRGSSIVILDEAHESSAELPEPDWKRMHVFRNFEELIFGFEIFEAQHPHRCPAWTRKEGSAVM